MVMSQKAERGSATKAMPATGNNANTPKMVDNEKMTNDGGVRRIFRSFGQMSTCLWPRFLSAARRKSWLNVANLIRGFPVKRLMGVSV